LLPISLSLKNFLSYREAAPVLRLDDVHVACLCGPNGNGKSALLDAITWALWGRARGQRQEQLLHHGQDEMSVELEFGVGPERFRVVRRYSRARRTPQSSLELSVFTGGDYRPITGNTIAETQADIIRRTNMDYDTFVNSAFLVQGRADLFTMSTPTQRKDVLAKVLGLGLYERLEERAKLRNRELQGELSASAHDIDRLREQVGRGDELRESQRELEGQLETARQQAAGADERLALLLRQVEQLERRQAEAGELQTQAARAGARRGEARNEVIELERRLGEWRQAVARRAAIEEGFVQLGRAREELRSLNAAGQAVYGLQRELSPLDQRITSERASLESQLSALEHRVETELSPKVDSLPGLEERLTEANRELKELDAQSVVATAAIEQEQMLRVEARRLEVENSRLTERGKETRAKLDLLDHDHEDGVACPLCGTELEADARGRIQATYLDEIEQQRALFKTQSEKSKALGAQAVQLAERSKAALLQIDGQRRSLDAESARLAVQRDEAAMAAAQIDEARRGIDGARARLERGEYAGDEQIAARRLRVQIAELAFDSHAIGAAEQAQRELEHWDVEHQALTQAQSRLPEDEAALVRATSRITEAEEEITSLEAQEATIAKELAELPGYRAQASQVRLEADAAKHQRDELQARHGSLMHQIEKVLAAEAELKQLEAQRKDTAQEAGAFGELALAFGKGGVQALLIEAAIPRLEDEANDLLKQMTDGRMSLKLETQRARRTGRAADGAESIETLEVVIADELGTRNYEMFSGGERFRVDFALRIALSKLLAWRAGAPLPTLFIDEGFGTQDAEGRDRILDVIKAIEDRFERILVITHLDEVKEAFPVRIEVTKTAAGSSFSMS
jgi:exonuclease SbcC